MITIGTLHKEKKLMYDGTWQDRDVIDLSLTLDERIADGFYFAKSLRIAKYMLEHPEVMNEPIREPVPVELERKSETDERRRSVSWHRRIKKRRSQVL